MNGGSTEAVVSKRRWNWALWVGFVLCVAAMPSYFAFFARYPETRDIPWVNDLLFVAGVVLLVVGLRRAYGQPGQFRGKIFGSIFALISAASLGFFLWVTLYASRQLPPSYEAPRIGLRAPDFSLLDTEHRSFTLASLLATPMPGTQLPPRGVLLIFYRGYW
jgi:hypothetical protein